VENPDTPPTHAAWLLLTPTGFRLTPYFSGTELTDSIAPAQDLTWNFNSTTELNDFHLRLHANLNLQQLPIF
jgi:hypothetical protein